jgi:hypothetical protein
VELERLGRADALGARVLRARDVLLEDARALLERLAERLLLAREPHVDGLRVLDELGVGRAHELAHDAREPRQEARLDADPAALEDRAAHDPAQDVAAILVGGHDAVRDQERHAARVLGEDAQRAVGVVVLVVRAAAELLAELDQRQEEVRLVHGVGALLEHGHALEPKSGVDVLGRQRGQDALGLLVVLHEHEVPVLEEALVVATREVVLGAELEPAVVVELGAGAAGPGRARLPEVLRARQQHDPLAWEADRQPRLDRLLVGAEAERIVALEDRDPDALGVEAEVLQRELPRHLDRAVLEVVAEREVAEHLEERQVALGETDLVDVRRAEALLARGQPLVRRLLAPLEVRLERVHARADEQRRGVVAGDQRRGGLAQVVARLEEALVLLADLVGGHTGSVWTSRPRAIGTRASPARTAVTDMNAQPMPNASSASPGAGVPTIATHEASPSAAPIWRNIVWTPMPVESWSGRRVAAAVAVNDGSSSPTPVPVRICPGRIAVR